ARHAYAAAPLLPKLPEVALTAHPADSLGWTDGSGAATEGPPEVPVALGRAALAVCPPLPDGKTLGCMLSVEPAAGTTSVVGGRVVTGSEPTGAPSTGGPSGTQSKSWQIIPSVQAPLSGSPSQSSSKPLQISTPGGPGSQSAGSQLLL